jgi:hypothetical protein
MRPTPNPGTDNGRAEAQRKPETCNEVFDRFFAHCELRVSKDDMAFSTLIGYREILDRVFRPAIGAEPFEGILYSQPASAITTSSLFLAVGEPLQTTYLPYNWWTEVLETLPIRFRKPYNARHSYTSWRLMVGHNRLLVARH